MPCTVVGCHLLCSGLCLARGVVLQLFVHTYHRLSLSEFGTSITNAFAFKPDDEISSALSLGISFFSQFTSMQWSKFFLYSSFSEGCLARWMFGEHKSIRVLV